MQTRACRPLPLLLWFALAGACGGGSAPAPNGSAGASTPAGDGTPASGSGDGGVVTSTSTPSSPGGSDAGATTSPSGAGDAGSNAPSSGAPGPSSSAGCEALLPQFGDAVEVRLDTGTHAYCGHATTAPQGQVALGIAGAGLSGPGAWFTAYTPDGTAVGARMSMGTLTETSVALDPWFHWTDQGYQGLTHDLTGQLPPIVLRSWDHDGRTLADLSSFYATTSAPDGHGGSVVVAQPFEDLPVPRAGPAELMWVDGASQVLRRSGPLDVVPTQVLVQWTTGHVLVLVTGSSPTRAGWFDENGRPLTGWFDALDTGYDSTTGRALVLRLLLDGSVALHDGARWAVVFHDGVAGVADPPGWLTARPGTRLATIRQGQGYAVLPLAQGVDPSHLEIVRASGESCGEITLPAQPETPGIARYPGTLEIGQDGTLFQTVGLSGELGIGAHCAFRWWPRLLR